MKLRIDKKKLRKVKSKRDAFLALASSIIYQQISTAAGNAIYGKFLKLFGTGKPTPKAFLKLSKLKLKAAGISLQKASYLRDLAEKFADKTIDHKNLNKMTDGEVREHLLQIKGVGPWTVDMFLIFALGRPDILPVGDLGTKKGFQKAFGLRSLPSEAQMLRLAKPHAGERTILTLHLWHILDNST